MTKEMIGRVRGGVARAEALTPERRKEIAIVAASTRWSGEIKKIIASDRPLRLGGIEVPCYVLEGEIRVITQRGLHLILSLPEGGGKDGARKIVELMRGIEEKGINIRNLTLRANSPIKFRLAYGPIAHGYDVTMVTDICAVLIEAGLARVLSKRSEYLAARAAIIQHGFGENGIIGLVDEATGFQKDRAQDALTQILEAFIAKELQPYIKTFQRPFWHELYRLKGKIFLKDNAQPSYVGHWINDVIYHRLAPEILKQLRKLNPRQENGRRRHRHFQYLTANKGYPKLCEHLGSVTSLMKYSSDWDDFKIKLDKEHPRFDKKNEES